MGALERIQPLLPRSPLTGSGRDYWHFTSAPILGSTRWKSYPSAIWKKSCIWVIGGPFAQECTHSWLEIGISNSSSIVLAHCKNGQQLLTECAKHHRHPEAKVFIHLRWILDDDDDDESSVIVILSKLQISGPSITGTHWSTGKASLPPSSS